MKAVFLMGIVCMSLPGYHLQAQTGHGNAPSATQKQYSMQQIFIDRFIVPQKAIQEFTERVTINRNFIKKLPGFIRDAAYERTDAQGNLVVITVAVWENEEAINKAKEAVQAEYKKQGFNIAEMLERLNITIDRGIYKEEILQP